jgi:4a-hydroxytetrahydrobiopterin dehydratase
MSGSRQILSLSEIETRLEKISKHWTLKDQKLIGEYLFSGFRRAIGFSVEIGFLAESMDHHPLIQIEYRKIRLELWTHDSGGITGLDFLLAEKIESAFLES